LQTFFKKLQKIFVRPPIQVQAIARVGPPHQLQMIPVCIQSRRCGQSAMPHDARKLSARTHARRVVLWAMWAIENKLPTLPTGMRAWAFVGNVGNVVMEKKLIQRLQMRVTYSHTVRLYSTYNFYTVK
jgi:hypothetical protein